MMRRSTRCKRPSQPYKHQGHIWQQNNTLKGHELTETDACSWMGDGGDSDSLVWRSSVLQLVMYWQIHVWSNECNCAFLQDWPSWALFIFLILFYCFYTVYHLKEVLQSLSAFYCWCWCQSPTLIKMKYLHNTWMDCQKIWCRYMEPSGWCLMVIPWPSHSSITILLSEISPQLLDELPWNSVQIFMLPLRGIVKCFVAASLLI